MLIVLFETPSVAMNLNEEWNEEWNEGECKGVRRVRWHNDTYQIDKFSKRDYYLYGTAFCMLGAASCHAGALAPGGLLMVFGGFYCYRGWNTYA